ncbi:hypothetical protein FRC06_011115 [Ceratobasidium sp. 370]|nr:hypothetical protein FRC06_011115 [Ceratobasidium sp. 370]
MGKVKRSIKCPYCRKKFKRASGLERHYVQKAHCGKRRLDDLNGRTSNSLPSNTNAAPSPPSDVAGDDQDEQAGSPMPEVELSPRSCCSVTLEEVEDEDAPHFPQWGPHPFAQPTRASLYPERHPDPTAGVASVFYPVDEQPPPLYDTVLADPDVFREAYWLANLPIGQKDEEEYFKLPRTQGWHWNNTKAFYEEIDKLRMAQIGSARRFVFRGIGVKCGWTYGSEMLGIWSDN